MPNLTHRHCRRRYLGHRFLPLLPLGCIHHTYPEVTLSNRTFSHIHPALLRGQLLIERLIQGEAVNQVAAHVQAVDLASHLHSDALPLGVRQAHILQGDDMLGTLDPVGEVQGVCRAIGDNLKLPLRGTRSLQSQDCAPGFAILLEASREEEALLLLHGLGDLAEIVCGHRRDVVKPHKAISRHAGVRPPELLGPNGLSVYVADAEKIEGGVLVLVTSCPREQRKELPASRANPSPERCSRIGQQTTLCVQVNQ